MLFRKTSWNKCRGKSWLVKQYKRTKSRLNDGSTERMFSCRGTTDWKQFYLNVSTIKNTCLNISHSIQGLNPHVTAILATVPACQTTSAYVPKPVIIAEVNAPQNLSCELLGQSISTCLRGHCINDSNRVIIMDKLTNTQLEMENRRRWKECHSQELLPILMVATMTFRFLLWLKII